MKMGLKRSSPSCRALDTSSVVFSPLGHHSFVALLVGHEAHLVLFFNGQGTLFRFRQQLLFLGRNGHIYHGNGHSAFGGIFVAGSLHFVQHLGSHSEAMLLNGAVDNGPQLLLTHSKGNLVVKHVVDPYDPHSPSPEGYWH